MRPRAISTIGFGAAMLACSTRYHNISFDMGQHYALISYIEEHFALPTCGSDSDLYLDIMCGYPPVAHIIAAIFGYFARSPFFGMILVSAAGVFTIYAAILSMLRFEKDMASLYAAIALVSACFLMHASMLGAEVNRNYFFSQLVGTAFFLGFVTTERSLRPFPTLIAIFLLGWVYPITAVQLGCTAIISMLISRQTIISILPFVISAAGAVYFHPLFHSSAALANNNGVIGSGHIPAEWTIFVVIALAISSALLFWSYRRGVLPLLRPIPFISISAGIAGAGVVQYAALRLLSQGSDYIVYKHLFGAFTMLVANIIVWIIVVSYRFIDRAKVSHLRMAWAAALGAVFCSMTAISPFGGFSTRSFADAERASRLSQSIVSLDNHYEQFALEVAVLKKPIVETADRHIREMQLSSSK